MIISRLSERRRLGAGRTLLDINYVDLFGPDQAVGAVALVRTINSVMGAGASTQAMSLAAIDELAAPDRPAALRRMTKEMLPDPARRIQLDDLISTEAARVLTAMRDETRFPSQSLTGPAKNSL